MMIRVVPLLCVAALNACVGAEDEAPVGEPVESEAAPAAELASLPQELESARAANDKYRDVNAALSDGYMQDPTGMCVSAAHVGAPAELGDMGVHYVHPGYLGIALPPGGGAPPPGVRLSGSDAEIDPERPEVLVYEPTADGGYELVALEYMVFEKAWHDAGNTEPPTLAGQEFYLMRDDPATELDEAHGFEPHYELHAWTHRSNPNGVFAEWNPQVTCPAGAHAADPGAH